ncbi:MAG: SsrA-binding protein [Candidatus Nomurabacteria bacterium]|jgi:SsrA-binding protein|nr:SsrA-binding protein [Candidatus Nomurabacteria bacterium]
MKKSKQRRGHKTASKQSTPMITNRRAAFDYELSDNLTVGLELTGAETKAARLGRVQLRGAYVTVKDNRTTSQAELFLINSSFSLATNVPKNSGQPTAAVDTRARKILAKRKEIDTLIIRKNSGLTIVPTKLLTTGRYIKLVIATGKGKKRYDKREAIKKRDLERESKRAHKS